MASKLIPLALLLISCSPTLRTTQVASQPKEVLCFLHPGKRVVLEMKETQSIIAAVDSSSAPYEILVVTIQGGQGIYCSRLSGDEKRAVLTKSEFYSNSEPKNYPVKTLHNSALGTLFNAVEPGHFMSVPKKDYYASEPMTKVILINKAGGAVFSCALDRECMQGLDENDQEKVAAALKLASYIEEL
jgi:hypothetical protein